MLTNVKWGGDGMGDKKKKKKFIVMWEMKK
jgi:hypothetical protein